jgi:hypothetical protein
MRCFGCCSGPPRPPSWHPCAARCRASGPGLQAGVAGQMLDFDVRVVDRAGLTARRHVRWEAGQEGTNGQHKSTPLPQEGAHEGWTHRLVVGIHGEGGALGSVRRQADLRASESEDSNICAVWTARRAGIYVVSVKLESLLGCSSEHLPGSPFSVRVEAGPVSPAHSTLEGLLGGHSSRRPLVATTGVPLRCHIRLRDALGNAAPASALTHTRSGSARDAVVTVAPRQQLRQLLHVQGVDVQDQPAETQLTTLCPLELRCRPSHEASAVVRSLPKGTALAVCANQTPPSHVGGLDEEGLKGRCVCTMMLGHELEASQRRKLLECTRQVEVLDTPKVRCGMDLSSAEAPSHQQFGTGDGDKEIQVVEVGRAKDGRMRLGFRRHDSPPTLWISAGSSSGQPLVHVPAGRTSVSPTPALPTPQELLTMTQAVGLDSDLLADMLHGSDGDTDKVASLLVQHGAPSLEDVRQNADEVAKQQPAVGAEWTLVMVITVESTAKTAASARQVGWVPTLQLAHACKSARSVVQKLGGAVATKLAGKLEGIGISWTQAWTATVDISSMVPTSGSASAVGHPATHVRCPVDRLQAFAREVAQELGLCAEASNLSGALFPKLPPGGMLPHNQPDAFAELMKNVDVWCGGLESWCSWHAVDATALFSTQAWLRLCAEWGLDSIAPPTKAEAAGHSGRCASSSTADVVYEAHVSGLQEGAESGCLPIELTVHEAGAFELTVLLFGQQMADKVMLLVVPEMTHSAVSEEARSVLDATSWLGRTSRVKRQEVHTLTTFEEYDEQRSCLLSELRVHQNQVTIHKTGISGIMRKLLGHPIFSMRVHSNMQILLPQTPPAVRVSGVTLCPSRCVVLVDGSGCQHRVLLANATQQAYVVALCDSYIRRHFGGRRASVSFADKVSELKQALGENQYDVQHRQTGGRAVEIHRGARLVDSFEAATAGIGGGRHWGRRWEVSFVGSDGVREPGSDWGGLSKELFTLLSSELLCDGVSAAAQEPAASQPPLFVRMGSDGLLYPNSQASSRVALGRFELAGRLLAKVAIDCSAGRPHEVSAHFCRPLYKQLLGWRVGLEDFVHLDPDNTKITYILDADDEAVEMLDLTMTFEDGPKIVPLIKDGERVPVTGANKRQYLARWANFALVKRQQMQLERMCRGFASVLPPDYLDLFNEQELELLLCGLPVFSAAELQGHARIRGDTPQFGHTLGWFWESVSAMDPAQLAQLLQFTTGSARLPAGGFAALEREGQHVLTIECDGSASVDQLPTAHTCFNKLDLPLFSSRNVLERALHTAIAEGNVGFAFA